MRIPRELMTMRADIRFWTAIFLIGVCGFSVTRGWSIVHFSLAAAEIDVFENLAEFINPWAAVRGSPRPRWREILFLEFDRLRVAYASRELLITRYRGAVCGIVGREQLPGGARFR